VPDNSIWTIITAAAGLISAVAALITALPIIREYRRKAKEKSSTAALHNP
jgi:flagellar biosynthesis/type III secretory pathway M-ring protein FliF/YscJ